MTQNDVKRFLLNNKKAKTEIAVIIGKLVLTL
jgi:hypothetical protein